jgi:uncharacterized membrane protein YwzB
MELVSDVIKVKKKYENLEKIDIVDDIENIQNKLRNLQIDKLIFKVDDRIIETKLNNILCDYFINYKKISRSILFSYHVSNKNSDQLSQYYSKSIDNRLSLACKKLTACIEYNDENPSDLIEIIDYQYSLFYTWDIKDIIMKMEEYHNKLVHEIQIYRLLKKQDMENNERNASSENTIIILREMFNLNQSITIKKILEDYSSVRRVSNLKNTFWSLVKIRIENIIKKIREHDLSDEFIANVIILLGNKCNTLTEDKKCDPEINLRYFLLDEKEDRNTVVNYFHLFFDILADA